MGGTLKSSVYRWMFHEIDHPAMGYPYSRLRGDLISTTREAQEGLAAAAEKTGRKTGDFLENFRGKTGSFMGKSMDFRKKLGIARKPMGKSDGTMITCSQTTQSTQL